MSVFLTPSLKPLLGGTYFPPGWYSFHYPCSRKGVFTIVTIIVLSEDRRDQAGLGTVVRQLGDVWRRKATALELRSDHILNELRSEILMPTKIAKDMDMINKTSFQLAFMQAERVYDIKHGGFGALPRFPRPVRSSLHCVGW
jgi:uncharacterized protein YyaL (SSP411 family)